MKSSLIILTYNEISGVKALFERIPFKEVDEAFVIDGGSTDGTIEFFEKRGIRVIRQKIHGRGEAFRIGMKEATGDYLIFFGPDGNETPEDILLMMKKIEEGNDMVIASRFMIGGRRDDSEHLIPYRGLGNRFFTLFANIIFGGNYTDTINGFRAIRKDKLERLHIDGQGFGIEYQISMRAMKLKYKVAEFPTYEGDRIGGKSTCGTAQSGFYVLYLLIREIFKGRKF
ncbi:MAG: glycosyltransferase family 2 protein [Candidatus Omnitrophica bacterium]|nr:glycosyltransferase family 2 protein [Candidatus Omnitrophota bacterium]